MQKGGKRGNLVFDMKFLSTLPPWRPSSLAGLLRRMEEGQGGGGAMQIWFLRCSLDVVNLDGGSLNFVA